MRGVVFDSDSRPLSSGQLWLDMGSALLVSEDDTNGVTTVWMGDGFVQTTEPKSREKLRRYLRSHDSGELLG